MASAGFSCSISLVGVLRQLSWPAKQAFGRALMSDGMPNRDWAALRASCREGREFADLLVTSARLQLVLGPGCPAQKEQHARLCQRVRLVRHNWPYCRSLVIVLGDFGYWHTHTTAAAADHDDGGRDLLLECMEEALRGYGLQQIQHVTLRAYSPTVSRSTCVYTTYEQHQPQPQLQGLGPWLLQAFPNLRSLEVHQSSFWMRSEHALTQLLSVLGPQLQVSGPRREVSRTGLWVVPGPQCAACQPPGQGLMFGGRDIERVLIDPSPQRPVMQTTVLSLPLRKVLGALALQGAARGTASQGGGVRVCRGWTGAPARVDHARSVAESHPQRVQHIQGCLNACPLRPTPPPSPLPSLPGPACARSSCGTTRSAWSSCCCCQPRAGSVWVPWRGPRRLRRKPSRSCRRGWATCRSCTSRPGQSSAQCVQPTAYTTTVQCTHVHRCRAHRRTNAHMQHSVCRRGRSDAGRLMRVAGQRV